MESIIRTGGSSVDRSADIRGLSTDTKPTKADGVPHGSTFIEMDTGKCFMFNINNDTWYEI